MGSIVINSNITLYDVLCAPQFHYNLLSISKLLSQSKSAVKFHNNVCYLQYPTLMRELEIGKELNGLYILNTTSMSCDASCTLGFSQAAMFDLWNGRIAHVSPSVLTLFPFSCKPVNSHPCDTCHLSKQVRNSFTASESCSTSIFELVHMDMWGPYRLKTHGNYTYFLTLVDDKSITYWLFLLPNKLSVYYVLTEFLLYVKT